MREVRTTMDKAERTQLKQLANESIIETFGMECPEARLAAALEQCVEELEFVADECIHCRTCPAHGDHDDETLPVNASEVLEAHKELTERLKTFKEIHVELAVLVAEFGTDRIDEKLADAIEELEQDVLGVERCVIP